MTSYFEVPLRAAPQRLNITLGQTEYQLTLRYMDTDDGGWLLDIADVNGNAILTGVPLVTGADLLAQYGHLNFGGRLWVQTLSDPDAVPTFENLGDDGKLYWVTA